MYGAYSLYSSGKLFCAKFPVPVSVEIIITGTANQAFKHQNLLNERSCITLKHDAFSDHDFKIISSSNFQSLPFFFTLKSLW